ncbi:MAG: hypothetical protein V2A69_08740 [Pseudomonadota bacterium]
MSGNKLIRRSPVRPYRRPREHDLAHLAHVHRALPLSLLSWPTGLLAALVLVATVESIVLWCVLGLSIWFSALVAFAANLVSTAFGIFGIPIALILLFFAIPILPFFLPPIPLNSFSTDVAFLITVSLLIVVRVSDPVFLAMERHKYDTRWKRLLAVTLFAPFLMVSGDDDWGEYYWMGPAACLTFLVPCFFASWYIESFVTNIILQSYGVSTELVEHGLFLGNLVSYGIIALVVALWLVMELLGVTWDDLLSAKRKFVAKLYGYKAFSEKPSRSRISNAYEPGRGGVRRDMDALTEAEARVLKSSSERQFQNQDKAKNENKVTVNLREVTKAA